MACTAEQRVMAGIGDGEKGCRCEADAVVRESLSFVVGLESR
mgnify:CR=1 FL=1